MKSAIFFDIDGTLITEDKRQAIPKSTAKAIELTRKKGNLTFINTGRTLFNIKPSVRSLGFDGLLCGCGTYIEYNSEILLKNTLTQDFCRKISVLMRECRVTPVYEDSDGYFFDDFAVKNPELDHFLNTFVSEGTDISCRVEDDNFHFDKFVVWESPESDMEKFRTQTGK